MQLLYLGVWIPGDPAVVSVDSAEGFPSDDREALRVDGVDGFYYPALDRENPFVETLSVVLGGGPLLATAEAIDEKIATHASIANAHHTPPDVGAHIDQEARDAAAAAQATADAAQTPADAVETGGGPISKRATLVNSATRENSVMYSLGYTEWPSVPLFYLVLKDFRTRSVEFLPVNSEAVLELAPGVAGETGTSSGNLPTGARVSRDNAKFFIGRASNNDLLVYWEGTTDYTTGVELWH